MSRSVHTSDAPRPVGPYVQAVNAGGMVFISGQIGLDPLTGKMVQGGAKEQTTRCMLNLQAILGVLGLDMSDVVRTTIFVTDMAGFKDVNEAYGSFFGMDPPARSTVGVAALPLGARVEIDAIAVRSSRSPP
jgi:2-iminobutanoate/2-iminopropanoate deaminase